MDFRSEIISVIRLAYPEYKNRIIFVVSHKKEKDYYAAIRNIWPFSIIYLDKSFGKMPLKARQGVIAHELAHIIEDGERGADKVAVDRGFGKHLIEFHEWHNESFRAYKKKDSLTLREIKKRMKKISKAPL